MKIIVLGPVLNQKSSGGVAAVSESLVDGFRMLGHDANIVSLEKSSNIDNVVVGNKKSSSLNVVLSISKIAKYLKKEKPDLVISSLQYNVGIKKYKKASPNTKFVAVIHGMVTPIRGRLRGLAINAVARYSSRHFDAMTTVSYLSQATNYRFYGIKISSVIPNGIGDVKEFAASEAELHSDRPFDFLYIGRLAKCKRIDLIVEAFKMLRKQTGKDLRMAVAGGGELSYLFDNRGELEASGIKYFGLIEHKNTPELYKLSRCFISANELENLGIVFMEAALAGCNIIHPYTCGGAQLFVNDPIQHFCDISSETTLCNDMERAINEYYQPSVSDIQRYEKDFSAIEMCKKYLALFDFGAVEKS